MMIFANTALFIGFFVISMSIKRHFKQLFPQRKMASLKWLLIFRTIGYTSLLLSASLYITGLGIGLGLVSFFGLLTLVTFMQSLCFSYKPQWLVPIGFASILYLIIYSCLNI